jgi:superfamily II DNA helicase RecQ
MNSFRDLEFLLEPIPAVIEQLKLERRTNMAREALRNGGILAAEESLRETRDQSKEGGEDSPACCKKIPKTIIYVDSIQQILIAVRTLTVWLIREGCSTSTATDAVQAYHSELAESDKRRISTEFAKPDTESALDSSKHRIIVATDAMGLGVNNPDVKYVIQWGVPPSMGALSQRAGRAARGKGYYGKFVWFVPPWCFGDKAERVLGSTKHLMDSERRSLLPQGIWELINRSVCIRKGILEFFGEDCTSYTGPAEKGLCCSNCTGAGTRIRIKEGRSGRTQQSQKHITEAVKSALVEWREAKATATLSTSLFGVPLTELVLPDKAIGMISRAAITVKSLSSLAYAVNGEWGDLAVYGKEVLEVVQITCLGAELEKQSLGSKSSRKAKKKNHPV